MAGAARRVASTTARIGPNAILQCMAALRASHGEAACVALMRDAGLLHHVAHPPQAMVDEADVQALHRTLRQTLGLAQARALGAQAGRATADYLLAHRIPGPMRRILPHLPAGLAMRVLMAAVRRHAWTFCGSGRFGVMPPAGGAPWRVSLEGSATSHEAEAREPLCDYFAATFERLCQVLVAPTASVDETACMAMGAPACVFEIRW